MELNSVLLIKNKREMSLESRPDGYGTDREDEVPSEELDTLKVEMEEMLSPFHDGETDELANQVEAKLSRIKDADELRKTLAKLDKDLLDEDRQIDVLNKFLGKSSNSPAEEEEEEYDEAA